MMMAMAVARTARLAPRGGRGGGARLFHQRAALAHEFIAADDATPSKTAVVMHGMLGNHKNMRKISTKLALAFPDYRMLLVTHRAHGKSERGEAPHDLDACAADLLHLLREQQVHPDILVGHSFGGKVLLAVVDQLLKQNELRVPHASWVLDSPPGLWQSMERDQSPSRGGVESVMSTLGSLPQPLESKKQLVELLTAEGYSEDLAQWMTLNVSRGPSGGFVWDFDLAILKQLFESHKVTDMWPLLDSKAFCEADAKMHFVRAGRNEAWTPEVLARFDQTPNKNVDLITMPDVGHWLHAEKPDELFKVMSRSFS